MLVVTDADDGLALGGIINFRLVDRRVRFEISLEAADRNDLTVSSRLLAVALRVRKGDVPRATMLVRASSFTLLARPDLGAW